MLKIYHVRGTRSVRPIWLCYELELEFQIEPIDFSESFRNTKDWRSISPAALIRPLGAVRLLRAKSETGASIVADAEQKTRTCLEVVDQAVANREFLLGSRFDAADIMMGYSLALLANNGILDDHYPHAAEYLTRLRSRDACRLAMAA